VSLFEFKRVLARSWPHNRIFQYKKAIQAALFPYKIWVVWPILHYFKNFIEADWIKIVVINPDIPLLTDGRQFAMGMAIKLPAVVV
jgi:hypothetical protein